jgi:hypothetical protein
MGLVMGSFQIIPLLQVAQPKYAKYGASMWPTSINCDQRDSASRVKLSVESMGSEHST